MTYLLMRDWRFITSVALQSFQGEHFQDIQFTLGRRVGARELVPSEGSYASA